MKPENWTDYEHPCFHNYDADPMLMTKEQFIAEADTIEDCDACKKNACTHFFADGGTWDDCPMGALSKHCDWLPKEGKND